MLPPFPVPSPTPPNPRYEIPTLTRSTGPLLTGTYFDYKVFLLFWGVGVGEKKKDVLLLLPIFTSPILGVRV